MTTLLWGISFSLNVPRSPRSLGARARLGGGFRVEAALENEVGGREAARRGQRRWKRAYARDAR
ncbi:hypothetical protein ACFPRL_05060 [Pseudoclavibacter helvolus]